MFSSCTKAVQARGLENGYHAYREGMFEFKTSLAADCNLDMHSVLKRDTSVRSELGNNKFPMDFSTSNLLDWDDVVAASSSGNGGEEVANGRTELKFPLNRSSEGSFILRNPWMTADDAMHNNKSDVNNNINNRDDHSDRDDARSGLSTDVDCQSKVPLGSVSDRDDSPRLGAWSNDDAMDLVCDFLLPSAVGSSLSLSQRFDEQPEHDMSDYHDEQPEHDMSDYHNEQPEHDMSDYHNMMDDGVALHSDGTKPLWEMPLPTGADTSAPTALTVPSFDLDSSSVDLSEDHVTLRDSATVAMTATVENDHGNELGAAAAASAASVPVDSVPSHPVVVMSNAASVGVPPLVVATMTAQSSLQQKVNLDALSILLPTVGITALRYRNQVAVKIPVDFNVQANVNAGDASAPATTSAPTFGFHTVSANVFSNGTIKLTGVKNEEECEYAVRTVADAIKRVSTSQPGELGPVPSIVDDATGLTTGPVEILMRKGDSALGFRLDLTAAADLLQSLGLSSEYEPAKYCGLKIRVPSADTLEGLKPPCVVVFGSGKVMVAARAELWQLERAFSTVASILVPNAERVSVEAAAARRQRVAVAASLSIPVRESDMPQRNAKSKRRSVMSSESAPVEDGNSNNNDDTGCGKRARVTDVWSQAAASASASADENSVRTPSFSSSESVVDDVPLSMEMGSAATQRSVDCIPVPW